MKRADCFLTRSVAGVYTDRLSAVHEVTIATTDEVSLIDGSLETEFVTVLWMGEQVSVRSRDLVTEADLFSGHAPAVETQPAGVEMGETGPSPQDQLLLIEALLQLSKESWSPTLRAYQRDLEVRAMNLRDCMATKTQSLTPAYSRLARSNASRKCRHTATKKRSRVRWSWMPGN